MKKLSTLLGLSLLPACSYKQINVNPKNYFNENCNSEEIELSPLKDSYCIDKHIAFREIINAYNFIHGDVFVRQNMSCRDENRAIINTYSVSDLTDGNDEQRIDKEIFNNVLYDADLNNDYVITSDEGINMMNLTMTSITKNLKKCDSNTLLY